MNPTANRTMGEIIAARFSRRGFLQGSMAATAISATVSPMALMSTGRAEAQAAASAFDFLEIEAGVDETHHVADGYNADILLRWGDPVFADAPEFDPENQTEAAQERQFGYNNDYVGYIPIDGSSEHGLLVVNHEYTNEHLMFPGIVTVNPNDQSEIAIAPADENRVNVEMAAHGGTIIEIRKEGERWTPVLDSAQNRRITAKTPMQVTGPAAGHARLQTIADPTGREVLGTINNCAGGVTPWGTYVMAEENFHGYFLGELPADHPEAANYERYGVPGNSYEWGRFHDRFDLSKEPNEPNRFGWIVEVDVADPTSTPKKRTALGRFKHEGAESIVAPNGQVVFYLGDDERFDYVYKFVTAGTYNPDDRAANMDLLDDGTLYVARFDEDGGVAWMPLTHGEGPLTAENGFESQADVLIETRRAADLLGATPMDRPEDIEPNGTNGRVYVMLTNNTRREEANAANPRVDNAFGHIVEIAEDGGDFAATRGTWEILVQCGDPKIAEVGATFSTATSDSGWFGMPDNCAVELGRQALDLHRRQFCRRHRADRRPLGDGHGGRGPRHLQALLPGADRRRDVRPDADAGPDHVLPRRAASGRRRRGLGRVRASVLLRGSPRPVGRTSTRTCRSDPLWSRSPRSVAAASADTSAQRRLHVARKSEGDAVRPPRRTASRRVGAPARECGVLPMDDCHALC